MEVIGACDPFARTRGPSLSAELDIESPASIPRLQGWCPGGGIEGILITLYLPNIPLARVGAYQQEYQQKSSLEWFNS